MKICKHNEGGHCLLSEYDWCVEGTCPHQEIVEFVPVVRCKDCKYLEFSPPHEFYCDYHTSNAADPSCDGACWVKEDDFCSYGKKKMFLKGLLTDKPIDTIEVRTYDPSGDDMLFGYCRWTGSELISEDGDSYSVDEEVEKWEYNEEKNWLTYWFAAEWSEDPDYYDETEDDFYNEVWERF